MPPGTEKSQILGGVARVRVSDGRKTRGTFDLYRGIYLIGRDETSDIEIQDPKASRRHCEIEVARAGCLVRDLESTYGTFVNGRRVEECPLRHGDEILVGRWKLHFLEEAEDPHSSQQDHMVELAYDEEMDSTVSLILPSDETVWLTDEFLEGEESTQGLTDRLATLYEVGRVISKLQSLPELFDNLLDLVFKVVPADRGFVVLVNEETGELKPAAMRDEVDGGGGKLTLSRTIARKVYSENISVMTHDATQDSRFKSGDSVILHEIRSAMCVPLASPSKVYGIFHVDTKFSIGVHTADHLKLLTAIANQAGIAIENVKLYEARKAAFDSLIETLAASIDARDPMTAGHSHRVARYSVGIAQEMGLSPRDQEIIRYAAFLHDYGKIGVRDAILLKPGKLTEEEYAETKAHAAYTYSILSKIRFDERYERIPEVASSHHERMNGSGYPLGLKGDEIPLEGRIIAVADVFDAIMSERHYKPAMSYDQAYDTLREQAGELLDREVVRCFLRYHAQLVEARADEPRPGRSDLSTATHARPRATRSIHVPGADGISRAGTPGSTR